MEKSSEFKKVRCKKTYGTWFYKKLEGGELDAPVYDLYTDSKEYVAEFGSYGDMKYYIETGIFL